MASRRSSHRASDAQLTTSSSSPLLDCTSECSLRQHSEVALSSAFLGNTKLLHHCASVCANPYRITDSLGRNVLHVAASRGHLQMVRWLLGKKKVKVDVADFESNWSALHRSIYYGHLGVGAYLVKCGADISLRDNDRLTPLSLLNHDRKLFKSQLSVSATNVYTWGRNSNVTLGHDHSRNYPERLDLSHDLTITQVILCKFHSVLLSEEGKVLTCGHGRGGRLGHDSEQSVIAPCVVKAMQGHHCTAIAAARDHTVILTRSGAVYTCGLNDAHQLGHGTSLSNVPPHHLSPRPVKGLKSKHVVAIGVGRYHTAMCTATEIYTVGKNLGQLGYEKTYDTQISPHAVAGINLDHDDAILQLSVSDAATACLTRKRRVFVCTDFLVKSIRCGFIEKSSCVQFTVCASLHDRDFLRQVETEPTKVLLLDSEHQVWFWEPTKKGSVPNVLPGLARHKVTQFSLGKSLTIVTDLGEVYTGLGSVRQPMELQRLTNIQNAKAVFTDFKANNFTYIQHIYQPLFQPELTPPTLTSDLAALLDDACLPGSISDVEIEVGGQVFPAHKFILASGSQKLSTILQPPSTTPAINGGTLPLQSSQLPLNCDNPSVFEAVLYYIYGSHIRVLRPPSLNGVTGHSAVHQGGGGLGNGAHGTGSGVSLEGESTPDTSITSVDENDLTSEYDRFARNEPLDDFDKLEPIPQYVSRSTPKKKTVSELRKKRERSVVYHMEKSAEHQKELQLVNVRTDLKSLQELANEFGLTELKEGVDSLLSSLSIKNDIHKSATLVRPRLNLKYQSQFSDLFLVSKEGKSIPCHRCVLVARSDYFRSMLLMGWRESSESTKSLTLPVTSGVLKAVVEFIYTDECPSVTASNSVEWVTSVLVIADQLLLTRLKDLCERTLANALDLRSAVDLLEFAEAYCAEQLKNSCLQFICVNAACFIEGRYLDSLDVSLLEELSNTYTALVPQIEKRLIKFPDPDESILPESYFLDDTPVRGGGEEWLLDGEQGYSEGVYNRTRDDNTDSFCSPSLHDSVSPRVPLSAGGGSRSSSSSSRRRKRRSSQSSESKKHLPSPSSASHSPPPQIPLAQTCPTPDGTPTVKSTEESVVAVPHTPNGSILEVSSSSLENGGLSGTPLSISHSHQRQREQPATASPSARSDTNKNGRRTPKTKLLNRFASVATDSGDNHHRAVPVESDSKRGGVSTDKRVSVVNGGRKNGSSSLEELTNRPQAWQVPSSPPPSNAQPAAVWTSFTKSVDSRGTSFREIMEREEQETAARRKQVQQSKHKSPPPPSKAQLASSPSDLVRRSATLPVSVPTRRQSSSDNLVVVSPSASTTSAQSPPVNPWKTSSVPSGGGQGASPSVSMRELMAEAEVEERRQRERHRQQQNKMAATSRRHSEERVGRRQPAVVPHQQVSFASIVRAQEIEEDRSRMAANKPLPLIQIEERAIAELEALYSAADNPDEFITVERYKKTSKSSQPLPPVYARQDSPWGV